MQADGLPWYTPSLWQSVQVRGGYRWFPVNGIWAAVCTYFTPVNVVVLWQPLWAQSVEKPAATWDSVGVL